MYVLRADLLDRQRDEGDRIAIERYLEPIGARSGEGRIEPDRDVPVALPFAEERELRFRLGNDRSPVRGKETDPGGELAPAARPFVPDSETGMGDREQRSGDAFEQSDEAELAPHLLAHVIAKDRVHQRRFCFFHVHNGKVPWNALPVNRFSLDK